MSIIKAIKRFFGFGSRRDNTTVLCYLRVPVDNGNFTLRR